MARPILLDTCAAIWLSQATPLRAEAQQILQDVSDAGGAAFVSPITAWEVGMLVSRRRLMLSLDPKGWFDALLEEGLGLAPLSPAILISSSSLPDSPLRDPADRILAATARAFDYRIMTRDRPLLEYALAGHLHAIAC